MTPLAVEVAGETLLLHPARVAAWPAAGILFAADLHLGKDATFRAAGLPIPAGPSEADLERLGKLVEELRTTRLVLLGDLVHAREGLSGECLASLVGWRAARPGLKVDLVPGNHDLRAGELPLEAGIGVLAPGTREGPFAFCHHPAPVEGAYVLCGHVHPGYRLESRSGAALVAPVFQFGEGIGVLPAFGSFTGLFKVEPSPGDRLFLVGPDRVVPLPAAATYDKNRR